MATIVTAPGKGGGPHVKVFEARSGAELAGFMAYDPSMRAGVSVATADLTGDQVGEVVTGPGEGGGSLVKVFDGRSGALIRAITPPNSAGPGGVQVTVTQPPGNGAECGCGEGLRIAALVARPGNAKIDLFD